MISFRKNNKEIITIILILFISIGFAYLYTNLYTNGTSIIKGTRWSIYFDNIDNENSTYQINNNATISEDKKSVDFEVTFEKPGDEYYFYVDVVNAGNLDAMLDSYEVTGLTADQKKYLEWNVTYADGIELKKYDLLSKESTDSLKVDITFIENVNYDDLPQESDISVSVKFKANYVQSDSGFAKLRDNGTYNIRYQLDGGTITNNPTTYTKLDAITIPNPTKEGYTFAGWTGGKNLFNKEDYKTSFVFVSMNGSWAGATDNDRSIYVNITPDTYYTIISTEPISRFRAMTYSTILNHHSGENENFGNVNGISNDGGTEMVIKSGPEDYYLYINFPISSNIDDYKDFIQIEQGNKVTDWEPYISTPTKDIILPKGSSGNRTYVANWIAN